MRYDTRFSHHLPLFYHRKTLYTIVHSHGGTYLESLYWPQFGKGAVGRACDYDAHLNIITNFKVQ